MEKYYITIPQETTNPRTGKTVKKRKRHTRCTIAVCTIIVIVATCYFCGRHYFSSHFFPGTDIAGTDCSLMGVDEAKTALGNALKGYSIEVAQPGGTSTVTASDMGMAYSSLDAVDGILAGQDVNLWFTHLFSGHTYADGLPVSIDETMAKDALLSLPCFNNEVDIAPENAYLTYDGSLGEYAIVEETQGNIMDEDLAFQTFKEALLAQEATADISGCLIKAEITSDDESLCEARDTANTWLNAEITYKDGSCTYSIPADDIRSFIVIDGAAVSLDEDVMFDYITDNICDVFNTVGTTRTVSTPSSGTITVSGGTYGYDVWRREEVSQLIEDIESGGTVTRTPVYYTEGNGRGDNDDIGDTYIDINISAQMVYLVEDGEVAFSTQCVTGCVSNGNSTPTGVYQVEYKTTNYTMKKYDTFVYYWMPIDTSTGVGLHDATWRSSFGGSIYKTNGSHGCINLPLSAAKTIYNSISAGIPVIVH